MPFAANVVFGIFSFFATPLFAAAGLATSAGFNRVGALLTFHANRNQKLAGYKLKSRIQIFCVQIRTEVTVLIERES